MQGSLGENQGVSWAAFLLEALGVEAVSLTSHLLGPACIPWLMVLTPSPEPTRLHVRFFFHSLVSP